MKINLIKYNTFILCLYINIFLTLNLKILEFPIPVMVINLILVLLVIHKINFNKFSLIIIFFLLLIILQVLYSNLKLPLKIQYIILFGNSIITILYSNLKISLTLIKKYMPYFLIYDLIVLFYLIFNKNLYYNKLNFNYMSWGYSLLPITFFLAFFYKENLRNKYLFFCILSLILLFAFGSRFTFLLGIFGGIVLLYKSKNRFIKIIIIFIFIILPFIIFNLKNILLKIIELLKITELPTVSIERLLYSLNNFASGQSVSAGRSVIYKQVIEVIKENFLFGSGIFGYIGKIDYRNSDGTFYPHNIILEILLQFGIIGIIVFFIVIFFVIRKIFIQKKKNYKLDNIYFIFLLLSLKLFLSSSYLQDKWFWFTLLIPFNKSYYYKIKNIK